MTASIRSNRMLHILAIIVTMLVCLAGTAFVAAARPDAILAHGDCENTSNISPNIHIGNEVNSIATLRAARVSIDPTEAGFRVCSHGSNDPGPGFNGQEPDSVSAWAMLTQPGTTNIAQVGIVRCNYQVSEEPDFCGPDADDGSDVQFFYLAHGCAEFSDNIENLGNADFYEHLYEIYVYNGTLYVKIDGVVEYSTNVANSERLSCWLDGSNDVKAIFDCEMFDEGDLCAHESDKLNFHDAQTIGLTGSTWQNAAWTDPCDEIDDTTPFDAHCDVLADNNDFDVWQVHN
jgi:hypothetical protein